MTHVSLYLVSSTTIERENHASSIGPYLIVDGMMVVARDSVVAERLADALYELATVMRRNAASKVAG